MDKQTENSLELKTDKYYTFPLPSIVTALTVIRGRLKNQKGYLLK